MTRVLVLVALAVLVWICLETAVRRLRGTRPRRETQGEKPERLVRCSSCGVHVPLSRSLSSRGGGEPLCERCSAR